MPNISHPVHSAHFDVAAKASLGPTPTGSESELKSAIDEAWPTITQGKVAVLARSEAAWLDELLAANPDHRPALEAHIKGKLDGIKINSEDVKTWTAALEATAPASPATPGTTATPTGPTPNEPGPVAPTPDLPPFQPGAGPVVVEDPVAPGTGTNVVDVQSGPQFNRPIPDSNYTLNVGKANEQWNSGEPKFQTLADLFTATTKLPNGMEIKAPTHMMGQSEDGIRIRAYNNIHGPNQKDLTDIIKPGEIAISIKHHSVHPDSDEKEAMKMQCTHIQIAVGVETEDGPGVITLNNPQNYEKGLFGDPSYPMIFVKPEFPEELTNAEVTSYVDNIRTWLTIANTFTDFPGDYNGGDPLGQRSPDQIRKLGDVLLKALTGTPEEQTEAEAWLADPANEVYCAELAHVALNLGIHYPLNAENLGDRLEAVKAAVASKDFLSKNKNEYAPLIDLKMAPDSLQPIASRVADVHESDVAPGKAFGSGMAIQPFTVADIVEQFVMRTVPREKMGEGMAPVQAAMLQKAKPGLLEALKMDQLPETDPKRMAIEQLYGQLVQTVGTSHGSYAEFRGALKPLMMAAQKAVGPRDDGTGAFIPPHAYLVRSTDAIEGKPHQGVLGWQYLGHGLHESLLDPKTT